MIKTRVFQKIFISFHPWFNLLWFSVISHLRFLIWTPVVVWRSLIKLRVSIFQVFFNGSFFKTSFLFSLFTFIPLTSIYCTSFYSHSTCHILHVTQVSLKIKLINLQKILENQSCSFSDRKIIDIIILEIFRILVLIQK